MFSHILECPTCEKSFRYECDTDFPEHIICPKCGAEHPSPDFSALVLCSKCRTKLGIPLDLINDRDLTCPKCGAEINVGENSLLTTLADNYSTYDGNGENRRQMFRRMLNDGDLFDKYRIVRLLGRGGMADVYLAEHLLLKQPCALKLMRSGLAADDPVFVKRFIREAKLAHKFNHPNIVKVYDAGSDFKTGYLFIAMEYVEGKTLLELLREGKLSEEILQQVLESMTRALQVLYEANVVHRDIKPSNIMLTNEGVFKLMDLGIAKYESDQQGEMTLTMDQSAIGTPGYASPEQCRSAHQVDTRSDIFCLGATLYHLASGQLPFSGETPLEIILKVLQTESVPLKKYRPDLSKGFLNIIDAMMKKDPDERPATPYALQEMIDTQGSFRLANLSKTLIGTSRDLLHTLASRCWTIIWRAAVIVLILVLSYFIYTRVRGAIVIYNERTKERQVAKKKTSRSSRPVKPPVSRKFRTMGPTSSDFGSPSARRPASAAFPPVRSATARPRTYYRRQPVNQSDGSDSIEARISGAETRIKELREALNSCKDNEERKTLNNKINFRNAQLSRLKIQLAVRERARNLDRSKFDAGRMENFKQKFAEYTRVHRDWGYSSRDIEFSKWLLTELKSGAIDPNIEVTDSTYPNYSGPLLHCITSGRIRFANDIARLLVRLGADTSGCNPGTRTNIMTPIIVEGGYNALSGFLLPLMKQRPIPEKLVGDILYLNHPVDERDDKGKTVLHYAAESGSRVIVQMLLLLDADINACNHNGETPLFGAVKNGNYNIRDILIKAGADTTIKNNDGKTALEMASVGKFRYAVASGNPKLAEELLKQGVDPNTRFGDGDTALQTACKKKNRLMVKLLLAHGADPNLGDERQSHGSKPLQLVFEEKYRDPAIFSMLLKAGADPNVEPPHYGGVTLLKHICDGNNRFENRNDEALYLEALLDDPRTDLHAKYWRGTNGSSEVSILFIAIDNQRQKWIINRLLAKTASFEAWDPAIAAAVVNDYSDDMIKKLIAKGANVNAVYSKRHYVREENAGRHISRAVYTPVTALYAAVEKRRHQTVELLLRHGADKNWAPPGGKAMRDLDTSPAIKALLK